MHPDKPSQVHPKMKKGHGSKFERKKEAAIAALMSGKSQAEAARAAGVDPSTLKRWMRLQEFIQEYRRARWEVAEQGYSRAQQNTAVAVAVLLKLMVESSTPASSRIRAALGVVDIARAGLDFDMETRLAALERSFEETKNKR